MRKVSKPTISAGDSFTTCISRVRNKTNKVQLTSIKPAIEAAAYDYNGKAEASSLHLIATMKSIGPVSSKEMVKTYDSRMVNSKQPGRPIYDQIKSLPDNDTCPFCNHRDVTTVDHVLPKQEYPIFAVTPINLVGCCSDCNKTKLDTVPTNATDVILHPYFDDTTDKQWLLAEVVITSPPALVFSVRYVLEWDATKNARIKNQFDLLELDDLYSKQAAREITNIRHNLVRHYDMGGLQAVRDELSFQHQSRKKANLSSWQTATYEALSNSDWFCEGGFSEE